MCHYEIVKTHPATDSYFERLLAETEQLLAGRARPAGLVFPQVPQEVSNHEVSHVTRGNVFADLGFDQEEAALLANEVDGERALRSSIRIRKAVDAAE